MKRSAFAALLIGGALSLFCNSNGTGPEDGSGTNQLPLVQIDTDGQTILNDPKIEATLILSANDEIVLETPVGIEYRGSSSNRLWDKYSYGFETRDANGDDLDVEILNLPEEEDWVLNGPYSDKTLIRNVLLYDLARELGYYASRTEFVELEVNGDFMGTYVLMEKLKRDSERLDLTDLDKGDNSADKVSGGYIIKIDKTTGDTDNSDWSGDEIYTEDLGFRSKYGVDGEELSYEPYGTKQGEETYFLYEDPKSEDITKEQKIYIQAYINEFENALLSDDFSSTIRTYTDYINLDNFIDFFLLNELSANPDAYRLSTYLHKDRDGKLNMGPVWDYNIAWGNDGRSQTQRWIYQYNDYIPNDLWLVPFWWERLMEDSQFRVAVKERWGQLRGEIFSEANLNTMIDEYAAELKDADAIDRNFNRWDILGEEVAFNSYVGETYDDEIEYLKSWISVRLSWMDGEITSW